MLTLKAFFAKFYRVGIIGLCIVASAAAAGISYYQTNHRVQRPQDTKASEVILPLFVDKNNVGGAGCNDSGPGTLTQPFCTINKGLTTAVPGQTVYVRGGTYAEQVVVKKSGTSTGRITISAYQNEIPVIDGSGFASISYDGLVQINDNVNFITLSGFTIKRSPNMGLANRGSNNIISNNKIVLSFDSAIWHRFGTNTEFRNNEVYLNVRMFTTSSSDTTIACDPAAGWWPATMNSQDSLGALWEDNYVHNNCGEGIVVHSGDRVLKNTFRDNWSVNIYIDNGNGALIDGNFVYDTDTAYIEWPGSGRNIPGGIAIADESLPCSTFNNTISNNIVVNTRFGLSFYQYVACSGIIDTKIVNNTFINSWDAGIRFLGKTAAHSRSIIANNIFYSTRGKAIILENSAGFAFQNNEWYVTSGSSTGQFQWGSATYNFSKWSALVPQISGNTWSDPQFVENVNGDPSHFTDTIGKFAATSPAINKGVPSVATQDYFGTTRQPNPSIGYYEYALSTVPPTDVPTPLPTAVIPPTSTPIFLPSSTPTPTPAPLSGAGPSIAIDSPTAERLSFRSSVWIGATAKDIDGVANVKFYFDGKNIKQCASTSKKLTCNYTYRFPSSVSVGTHVIKITAQDNSSTPNTTTVERVMLKK